MHAISQELLEGPRDNLIQPFRIDDADVRGRLVRLGGAVDGILSGHSYPDEVAQLLAELAVVATAMSGAFRFEGTLSLQTSSDGPVPLMIAEYRAAATEDRKAGPASLRGYARYDATAVADAAEASSALALPARLLGEGTLAFTVEAGPDLERYQGIIALDGASIVDSVHAYFAQSDQLEAAIRVDVGRGEDGTWRAGGILVQRMPLASPPEQDRDDGEWRRTLALVGSSGRRELLDPDLASASILQGLFPEDDVRVWRPVSVEARCRCSRERVDRVLRSFPRPEIAEMVVDGAVTATCEFCNTGYAFSPAELGLN